MTYKILLFLITFPIALFAQKDTVEGEAEYLKHYDCLYRPGNILVVQKKGKLIKNYNPTRPVKAGFVIRMEAVYDIEFSDKKRYKSGVIKNITTDSITLTSTFNEKCAFYEGRKYELITYPISSIKVVRFISDRSLGLFNRVNIENKYDLIVKVVDKAKFCPALLTFPKRNYEVKVCHYYLTSQGYDVLFETNGFLDFMEYEVEWK